MFETVEFGAASADLLTTRCDVYHPQSSKNKNRTTLSLYCLELIHNECIDLLLTLHDFPFWCLLSGDVPWGHCLLSSPWLESPKICLE